MLPYLRLTADAHRLAMALSEMPGLGSSNQRLAYFSNFKLPGSIARTASAALARNLGAAYSKRPSDIRVSFPVRLSGCCSSDTYKSGNQPSPAVILSVLVLYLNQNVPERWVPPKLLPILA